MKHSQWESNISFNSRSFIHEGNSNNCKTKHIIVSDKRHLHISMLCGLQS
uniref:Uncharacterized protein n=1 Tax=Lepeophtheirus salmonis TaxID=72036 RepID=A0A0K2VH45_LEPSM